MTILGTCPSCGWESGEIRCPRCNALKVVGCSGSCGVCESSCETDCKPSPGAAVPSDAAPEDAEHPGTPLKR